MLYPSNPLSWANIIWKSGWKGYWYLVIFDVPERERRFRDKLRRKLIQFGFGQLQKSILICPIDRFDLIQKSVFYDEMKPYLVYLKVNKVYGFTQEELVAKCWRLGFVKGEYEYFMSTYEERIHKFLSSSGAWSREERKATSRWLLLVMEDELSKLLKLYPPLPRKFAGHLIPFEKLINCYQTWRKKLLARVSHQIS